jgi:methyl-accepting chemotaxis protein
MKAHSMFHVTPGRSLVGRLALAFGSILALLLAVGSVGLFEMSRLGARMDRIVEVHNLQMAQANKLIEDVDDLAIVVRTITLLTDVKEVDRQVRLFGQAVDRYQRSEAALEATMRRHGADAQELQMLERIRALRLTTIALMGRAAKLGGDGATTEATQLLMQQVRPVESQWRRLIGELVALETHLNAQAHAAARTSRATATIVLCAIGLAALCIGAVMAWRLARGIVVPVNQAIDLAECIAGGDLSASVSCERTDELGRLLAAVLGMQAQLRGLVSGIRASADAISTASGEIASGNQDLSVRTERQAASLQKTSSNMEELTAKVRQNADSAYEADTLAVAASSLAARGGQAVSEVVRTMTEIELSSKKIGDIVGVIDGLAFRTNILALNAAVEAARAGEQGRGFAVVAAEVRGLAQRSAEAAQDIRALILTSTQRVQAGAVLVEGAGTTMRELVASVQRVSSVVSEITCASNEQRDDIGAVNQEVKQLDHMTQQNAALVEQSAAATASLREQADRLAAAIHAFRLTDAQLSPAPTPGVRHGGGADGTHCAATPASGSGVISAA